MPNKLDTHRKRINFAEDIAVMDAVDCIAALESSDRSEVIRNAIRSYLAGHPEIDSICFADNERKVASRMRDRLHLAIGLRTAEAIQEKNSICNQPKFDISNILG